VSGEISDPAPTQQFSREQIPTGKSRRLSRVRRQLHHLVVVSIMAVQHFIVTRFRGITEYRLLRRFISNLHHYHIQFAEEEGFSAYQVSPLTMQLDQFPKV
jgi:hypothetical protein